MWCVDAANSGRWNVSVSPSAGVPVSSRLPSLRAPEWPQWVKSPLLPSESIVNKSREWDINPFLCETAESWRSLLLQHNLTYAEARRSSKDLALGICSVLSSILILPLLLPEPPDKWSDWKPGESDDRKHLEEIKGRVFSENTGP